MNYIICVILLFITSCNQYNGARLGFSFDSEYINVEEAVSYLNSIEGRTWTAGANNFGEYLSKSEIRARSGSFSFGEPDSSFEWMSSGPWNGNGNKESQQNAEMAVVPYKDPHIYHDDDIPDEYDTRMMFPYCSTISSIKDQSNCGSCWAVSTAAAFSDRLCIHSRGSINVNISSAYLMSCVKLQPKGACFGGTEAQAWLHLKNHGGVTGGDYGTFEGCQPYWVEPCGEKDQMPCTSNSPLTSQCIGNKCTNEWYQSEETPYKCKNALKFNCNETHPCSEMEIRQEIYQNGPVVASFLTYGPFSFYKSGIFETDTKKYNHDGGHAVRIIGWGVENKIPFWLVANSWGRLWGENGTFRIVRGKNHCNIESNICFCTPQI